MKSMDSPGCHTHMVIVGFVHVILPEEVVGKGLILVEAPEGVVGFEGSGGYLVFVSRRRNLRNAVGGPQSVKLCSQGNVTVTGHLDKNIDEENISEKNTTADPGDQLIADF